MTSYFDSSALVAMYVTERFSKRARHEATDTLGIPYTPLQELEVSNALQRLQGRGALEPRQLREVLGTIAHDRETRLLCDSRLGFFELFNRAIRLSAVHATRLLCRSLDILHVAAALQLGCARFVSSDDRQLALARAEGLEVADVKQRRPRRLRD